jgi:hypothetical protein
MRKWRERQGRRRKIEGREWREGGTRKGGGEIDGNRGREKKGGGEIEGEGDGERGETRKRD